MLRLLSRGRKAEGGENEAKKYKKADLGLSNQMYYNEELKMWVEKGKEDEARAEKAKMSAPPPSVGSMSAASSTTSLTAFGEAAAAGGAGPAPPQVPNFSRRRGLADRYVSTIPTAGATPAGASSPAPAPPKSLLPGGALPGGPPKLPVFPSATPGSGPPSFFMPTPAASEINSETLGGSELGSVSGLSGMDASFPDSRNASQPSLFVPGPPASSSSTATDEASAAAPAGEGSQELGSSSGGGAMAEQQQQQLPQQSGLEVEAMGTRESSASGSSRVPSLGGPGSLSFTTWQRPGSQLHISSSAGAASPQQLHLQQSSSASMSADAEAEVSSPDPMVHDKQQQQQYGTLPDSNGMHSGPYCNGGYASADPEGLAEAPPTANGSYEAAAQQPLGDFGSTAEYGNITGDAAAAPAEDWDSKPARDPFAAEPAGPPGDWGQAEGGYGWTSVEGGESNGNGSSWQQPQYGYSSEQPQQPYGHSSSEQPQQQDPFAVSSGAEACTSGWEGQQGGEGWDHQATYGGWDATYGAAAEADAAEGGVAAEAAALGSADAVAQHQQQPEVMQAADDSAQSGWAQQQQQQGNGAAADYDGYYQSGYQQQHGSYSAEAVNGYQQQYDGSSGYHQSYAHVDSTAAGPSAGVQQEQQQQEQLLQQPTLLDPVHPELPGIAVTKRLGSGSVASPTYPPGSSSGSGSKGKYRHCSMPGSPPSHQKSLDALLPQPPRSSTGGLGAQQSMGKELQAEAAALTVPTPAAAGDASMLYAVRPSSPYARAVSPLSRTSTAVSDTLTGAGGGGFPIPSPPGHSNSFGHRPASNHMFIPSSTGAVGAAPAGSPWQPWQPGATACAGQAAKSPRDEQQQEHPPANGYIPQAAGPGHEQQQQPAAFGRPASSPAQGWMPGVPESVASKPDAQPRQCHRDGSKQAAVADGSSTREGSAASGLRSHPYEQFLAESLARVNWRAHHFKQPGKLNKLLPWEEWEMEKARKEEQEHQQQQQSDGVSRRREAFWYKQMEHRKTLPAGAMKPSASEPAAMPSHAVGVPPAPIDSTHSQANYYGNWQQSHQHHHHHHQPPASPPITPMRAATIGAVGAVAADRPQQPGEEPTPTSKFVPVADAEDAPQQQAEQAGAAAEAAGAEAVAADQAAAELQQQGEVVWQGYAEQQQQPADAAYGDAYWQQYGQQYGQYEGYDYSQQYHGQEQYGAYQQEPWQQQEAAAATPEQLQLPGIMAGEQQDQDQNREWGSPDAMMPEAGHAAGEHSGWEQQQQQDGYLPVAPGGAAWGVADAGYLRVQAQQQHVAAPGGDALHPPEVVAAALTARISCSSLELESQPSTGRAAAAAAKHIVGRALDNIMREHAVQEETEQEVQEAAAAALAAEASTGPVTIVDGWLGEDEVAGMVADAIERRASGTFLNLPGPEGEAAAAAEQAEASAAGSPPDVQAEGSATDTVEEPQPLPSSWVRLREHVNHAAADAAAAGTLTDELRQYQEHFVLYGNYVLGLLPAVSAAEAAADAAAEPAAVQTSLHTTFEEAANEGPAAGGDAAELEEIYAEFGQMELKNDLYAALFGGIGLDAESVLSNLGGLVMC